MSSRTHAPNNAITLARYAELDEYVRAFARGYLNLLLLVGPPGLQKSRSLKEAVGTRGVWIEGHATPFGIYRRLWESRNQAIVIDDVDALYSSREGLRILKSLCQTEPIKTVSWNSETPTLRRDGIPRKFTTVSRVAIIANEWKTLDRNVSALEDRGVCILFEPTPLEVHLRTGAWFWDQEIFDFLGERLRLFPELSMRIYRQLSELKEAGIDWRSFALKRALSGTRLLVAELKADPTYSSEKERIQAFIARGAGSRTTYFAHAKKLRPSERPPPLTLKSAPPAKPEEALLEARLTDLLARARRWEKN